MGRLGLSGEVKRLGSLPLHAEGQFERGDAGVELAVQRAFLPVQGIQPRQGVELRPLPIQTAAPRREIRDGILEVADQRSLVGTRQKARRPQLRPLKHGGRADHHKTRQILVFGPQTVRQPRAQAGTRKGLLAGAHLQRGPCVIDVVGHHRANHTDIVDARSKPGQQFAHLDAGPAMLRELPRGGQQVASLLAFELGLLEGQGLAVVGREPGLGVKQIDMRRSPGHVQKNHPLGPGGVMTGKNAKRMGRAPGGNLGQRLARQQVRQGQRTKAAARGGQPVAAGERRTGTDFGRHGGQPLQST